MPMTVLTPETLLSAYCQGSFPMTDADGVTRWYTADPRGILPLDGFHCPRTLRQLVKQRRFDVRFDENFTATMRSCMTARRPESGGSWISEELVAAYTALHERGFAHSVEAHQDGRLVGGLYGVAVGGAFFGESMFHHVNNASKVCLVHLVERLRAKQFTLLDTQMVTAHMRQFGTQLIPAREYRRLLGTAIRQGRQFP
jgi:leucyl/phenylalanyl-tRNA--protein transferase